MVRYNVQLIAAVINNKPREHGTEWTVDPSVCPDLRRFHAGDGVAFQSRQLLREPGGRDRVHHRAAEGTVVQLHLSVPQLLPPRAGVGKGAWSGLAGVGWRLFAVGWCWFAGWCVGLVVTTTKAVNSWRGPSGFHAHRFHPSFQAVTRAIMSSTKHYATVHSDSEVFV